MKNISASLLAFLLAHRKSFRADLITIAPGPFTNLLEWSQDSEKSVWSLLSITVGPPVITPDFIADPNGGLTADKWAFPSTIGGTSEVSQPAVTAFLVGLSGGQPYTLSAWMRADSPVAMTVSFNTSGAQLVTGTWNLTTQWQRFQLTGSLTPDSLSNAATFSLSGVAANNVYFWGGQLEPRAVAGPYTATQAAYVGEPRRPLSSPLFLNTSDTDIAWNGNKYLSSKAVKMSRSTLRWGVGLTVDTLDVQIDALPTDNFNGLPILPQLLQGVFDGARFQLDRLYGSSFGNWVDSLTLFAGNVADVTNLGRTRCALQVRSRLELLNNSLPMILFQPACRWALFDAGCALQKDHFAVNGLAVASGSNAATIKTNDTHADGYFNLGTATFLSGPNKGLTATIKQSFNSNGQLLFVVPLPNAPQTGDNLVAYPGCDKLQSTCSGKFANLINFGGMPYVPVPEAAL